MMADDSGLVIDALNGEPGIYSARYLGHDTSYREKNGDLIRRLTGISDEQRSARFVCAMAAVCPDGEVLTTEAAMKSTVKTDLVMIRSFICPKEAAQRQSCP